jgi:hypothetical protein
MKSNLTRICSAVVMGIAFAATAHAEYRCDPAPTWIDQRACEAAEDSPQALRQYVQRMRWFTNLQFSDYVNENTAQGWEAKKREMAAQKSSDDDVISVAFSERG